MAKTNQTHINTWAAEYQHNMELHDTAITKAIYYRNRKDPDLARFYYEAGKALKELARSL